MQQQFQFTEICTNLQKNRYADFCSVSEDLITIHFKNQFFDIEFKLAKYFSFQLNPPINCNHETPDQTLHTRDQLIRS